MCIFPRPCAVILMYWLLTLAWCVCRGSHVLAPDTGMMSAQVWIGYNQSLRPCQSGLTLNMDITAAAFLEGQPMLQLIGSTVGMQSVAGGLNPGQVRTINKAIRGVQVMTSMC